MNKDTKVHLMKKNENASLKGCIKVV